MRKLNFKGKSKIEIVSMLKTMLYMKEISEIEYNTLYQIYGK